jgi:thiazole synthase
MTKTVEIPETRVAPDDPLEIAGRTFRSRLFVGTGKYGSNRGMVETIRASGAEVVTVAVRRIDLDASHQESILHHLDPEEFFLLPNTAGCYTAEEAVRYARLGREAGLSDWVKLEVIGDKETLLPDNSQLLEATEQLVAEGFVVLPYTNDDLITALRLEEIGAAAVMPLASPIGSGLGLLNPMNIRIMKQRLSVPVIVDTLHRRRRCGDGLRRLCHHGARRGRNSHEHRPGGGGPAGANGARHATGRGCRADGLSGRPDEEA